MEQYVCHNVKEVMETVYELTRTRSMAKTRGEKKEEMDYWRGICDKVKAEAMINGIAQTCISDFSAFDQNEQEIEVDVYIGYDDEEALCWLVWIET